MYAFYNFLIVLFNSLYYRGLFVFTFHRCWFPLYFPEPISTTLLEIRMLIHVETLLSLFFVFLFFPDFCKSVQIELPDKGCEIRVLEILGEHKLRECDHIGNAETVISFHPGHISLAFDVLSRMRSTSKI